jgi:NAD(P)-dependent dehydrogenase (short-subunit alcohol dehydrogenase family)
MADKPKNIIVSGSARGIGRCLARTFLEKGHCVFLIDIDEEELEYCATVHLKEHSDRVSYAICNLRSVDAIRDTVAKAAKFFNNEIDVLINNGGIASPKWKDGKTFEDKETIGEWQAYIETNLTAPFAMSQACIPYMKHANHHASESISTAGPCIIHVGSFRAHQSDPNQEGYASTKSGQLGLMHSMAITCERWGIRVNLIAPGRIKVAHESKEGDEKGDNWEDQLEEKDVVEHPANRAGRPSDIAQAAEYLINAGFVTGQELTVDGGALKKKNK